MVSLGSMHTRDSTTQYMQCLVYHLLLLLVHYICFVSFLFVSVCVCVLRFCCCFNWAGKTPLAFRPARRGLPVGRFGSASEPGGRPGTHSPDPQHLSAVLWVISPCCETRGPRPTKRPGVWRVHSKGDPHPPTRPLIYQHPHPTEGLGEGWQINDRTGRYPFVFASLCVYIFFCFFFVLLFCRFFSLLFCCYLLLCVFVCFCVRLRVAFLLLF